jgi:hypothetical protein
LRDVVVDWSADEVVLSGEVSAVELVEIARQMVTDRLRLPVEDRIRVTPTLRELPGPGGRERGRDRRRATASLRAADGRTVGDG